ncbi:MAG: hypothetical protein GF400_10005 [Candidatus Eisenbacteria bacterium]|nr:hypothetical protein [Candidatus Eisenbacteria bacterium]
MRVGRSLASSALVCAALVLCSSAAFGIVPQQMNYQVMLTDDMDQPLAEQTVDLDFRIFADPVGGPVLWSESHTVTTNSIGVASVTLGSTNPLSIDFDIPLWLEVVVEGDVLAPRRELVASPYALNAKMADHATSAGTADTAAYADTAGYALATAGSDTALYAHNAGYADTAGYALAAPAIDSVAYADTAGYALATAGSDTALYAHDAGYADTAGYALAAPAIDSVAYADTAGYALAAPCDTCDYAMAAGSAATATTAGSAADADSLGGVAAGDYAIAADYVLATTLGDSGTINDAGNPVTWTKLKDVPAGFADGTDDTGTGDGHSLDASDGSPTDAVAVDTTGNVTIAPGGLTVGDTSGGQLEVEAPGAYTGLFVEGDDGGDGSPLISASGAGSSFQFDLSATGDSSVVLPNDAVGSSEMLDEPGAACYYDNAGDQILVTYGPAASHSITVPAEGYVFVMASAQANCTHDTTGTSRLYYGVSEDSTTINDGLDQDIQLPDTAPAGAYRFGIAPAAVFPVSSAGTYTFYLTASADGGWFLYDIAMNLLYFPTAYGTVYTPSPPMAALQPDDEVTTPATGTESRRAGTEAWSNARLQSELEEMEARIAEIRAKIERGN